VKVEIERLELALPDIHDSEWCHAACRQRWLTLTDETREVLGGHIHFDAVLNGWTVPFVLPLRHTGVLRRTVDSDGGRTP
jgi:hypothetical protein